MTTAYFGMGLLGANFVRALRRRGEEVHVWNRSPAKALRLADAGAVAFDEPAEAARGASRVHLSLSDDDAVDEVLERAQPGFDADVVLIDHTTTSATGTAARAERWQARGVGFLHAPVFMGPQNALEGTGVMLASGDRARFDALSPELSKMTGRLVYLGADPARAAAFKLLGNLFLMFLTTGMADMLALARALGVSPYEAATLFDTFNPGTSVGARMKRILEADFDHPSWELSMARKDARLMLDEAARGGVALAVLPEIAAEMDRWIERGHAQQDWTVLARNALG